MKKEPVFILCFILWILILIYVFGNVVNAKEIKHNDLETNTSLYVKYDISTLKDISKIKLDNITITSYNNKVAQCDKSPNIMASNRLVYEGAIAISQDLKKAYKVKFGDLIYIPALDRYFVVEDVMNKKWTNRLDIFSFDYNWSKKFIMKDQEIIIIKIGRNQ